MVRKKSCYLLLLLPVLFLVTSKVDYLEQGVHLENHTTHQTSSTVTTLANEHDHGDGWIELTSKSGILTEGNYYLSENVVNTNGVFVLNDALTIYIEAEVSICLNGYTMLASANTYAIDVRGALSLYDCSENSTGTINFYSTSSITYGVQVSGSNSSFTMYGGTISQLNEEDSTSYSTPDNSFGVYVINDGSFVMEGGSISHLRATNYAYGLYVDSSTLIEINDGEITDIVATRYAFGIYSFSSVVMNGGTISEISTSYSGGSHAYPACGIYVDFDTTLEVNGGTISNISSASSAYGIFQDAYSTLKMTDGTISNISTTSSTIYACGIYQGIYGTVEITGGEISNISSSGYFAYGLYQHSNATLSFSKMKIANISGSIASRSYGIYIYSADDAKINSGYIMNRLYASSSTSITVYSGYFDDNAYSYIESYSYMDASSIYFNLDLQGGVDFDEAYDSNYPNAIYAEAGTLSLTASVPDVVCVGTDYRDKIQLVGNVSNAKYTATYHAVGDTTEYDDLPTEIGEYVVTLTFPNQVYFSESLINEYYLGTTAQFEVTVVDHDVLKYMYDYDDYYHWEQCSRCDTHINEVEHTIVRYEYYSEQSHRGSCILCGTTMIQNHIFSAESRYENICTVCGYEDASSGSTEEPVDPTDQDEPSDSGDTNQTNSNSLMVFIFVVVFLSLLILVGLIVLILLLLKKKKKNE